MRLKLFMAVGVWLSFVAAWTFAVYILLILGAWLSVFVKGVQ